MELEQKFIISKEVLGTEIDDETVLLDIKSEKYFGFDIVGSSILQALQEYDSLTTVYETLLTEYDVDPEILKKDLLDFVLKLEKLGIVAVKPHGEKSDTSEL